MWRVRLPGRRFLGSQGPRSPWLLLVVAAPVFACLSPVGLAAGKASATVPNLTGSWSLVEHWENVAKTSPYYVQDKSYGFVRTGPNTYSVSNGDGWTTADVVISGPSVVVWFCGAGGTHSQKDEGACPATQGHWLMPWTFNFKGSTLTATGSFQAFNPDGSKQDNFGTFVATGPANRGVTASLSVAVSAAKPELAIDGETTVKVNVTASGSKVSGISLGRGLVASSDAAVVSHAATGLSGFDLAEGASRSFEFKVKGAKSGKVTLKATAQGTDTDGKAVQGSAATTLQVVEGVLSVEDVTRGTSDLAADVRVKFKDSSADASGCDPKASYDFKDPELASTKKVGLCNYELTFQAPGTGIYHVGLKATDSSGKVTPVSVDQYGATVDGTFNLIIDSCSRPQEDVPDVEALLDASSGVCAVAVGGWDHDAAEVASKVLAADESSPDFEILPISVDSVDPADWPGSRGLVLKGKSEGKGLVMKSANTGWVPIGTNKPPEIVGTGKLAEDKNGAITGGDTAALVQKLRLPPLPAEWSGAKCPATNINPNDVPDGTVISSHGLWYPPNGLVRVPAGDQISTYVPMGTSMQNECLGIDIDTGHTHGDDARYLHVYTAGQLMPNFTFVHYDGGGQGKHVTNPENPITLNALIRPNEGRIAIAACATLYVPAGLSLSQALSSLPVHAPGTATTLGYRRVTITSQGEIQTSAATSNP